MVLFKSRKMKSRRGNIRSLNLLLQVFFFLDRTLTRSNIASGSSGSKSADLFRDTSIGSLPDRQTGFVLIHLQVRLTRYVRRHARRAIRTAMRRWRHARFRWFQGNRGSCINHWKYLTLCKILKKHSYWWTHSFLTSALRHTTWWRHFLLPFLRLRRRRDVTGSGSFLTLPLGERLPLNGGHFLLFLVESLVPGEKVFRILPPLDQLLLALRQKPIKKESFQQNDDDSQ